MRNVHPFLRLIAGALLGLPCAQPQTFTTFSVPGATETSPACINDNGQTAGDFTDLAGQHGFVRDASGNITTFDPPGSTSTSVSSINSAGTIVGSFNTAPYVYSGFIRNAAGQFTTINFPNSVSTVVYGINDHGEITGNYQTNQSNSSFGFVRDVSGTYTSFSVTENTSPSALNNEGFVIGSFDGARNRAGVFVRSPKGGIAISRPELGQFGTCINDYGDIGGQAYDNTGFPAFVRLAGGATQVFQVNGSNNDIVVGVNLSGTSAGWYLDHSLSNYDRGFIRATDGTITLIDVPGYEHTYVSGINSSGIITGGGFNDTGIWVGFVYTP